MSELPTLTDVIPDSIEPYLGYKALVIGAEAKLFSPSEMGILWPVRKPLVATCTRGLSDWAWVPVEGEPRATEQVTHLAPGGRAFQSAMAVTAVSSASAHPRRPSMPPKPSNPLPPGWSWSWEALTHDAPAQGCSCGIYAVSEPSACLSYVKPDGVIAEVAVWGNTVPASSGVRGQFAYPQRLLAPKQILDEVRPTAQLYGIPILVLDAEERVEQEEVDVTPMGAPTKQTLSGKPKLYIEPAEMLGEMIAANELPPAVEVKAEDPVLKALKTAAKRLREVE